jgi:stage V sporulation protein SpoVS
MRTCILAVVLALAPGVAGAEEPALPRTVAEAQALLDGLAADLEAYRADANAQAAAPDAIRQAGEAIDQARTRLAERGVDGAVPELRRAQQLLALIAELIEARSLEQSADGIAEQVVEALERLAVVRDAYERITEQLQLFAIPMPGEAGR